MLSKAQEKLIRSLHTKKGRAEAGLLLLEGEKAIHEAGKAVEFTFTAKDSTRFSDLVTTVTPQLVAGIARIPIWTEQDVLRCKTIVVLDHVQDPGNVGTILRSALAFGAAVVLVECVDPTNPKVVRSAAGAVFHTPWLELSSQALDGLLARAKRVVYRLENRSGAMPLQKLKREPMILVAGSEGAGITLAIAGKSLVVEQNPKLESLNVAVATSIVLYESST